MYIWIFSSDNIHIPTHTFAHTVTKSILQDWRFQMFYRSVLIWSYISLEQLRDLCRTHTERVV